MGDSFLLGMSHDLHFGVYSTALTVEPVFIEGFHDAVAVAIETESTDSLCTDRLLCFTASHVYEVLGYHLLFRSMLM
jgi:hypothetical protein